MYFIVLQYDEKKEICKECSSREEADLYKMKVQLMLMKENGNLDQTHFAKVAHQGLLEICKIVNQMYEEERKFVVQDLPEVVIEHAIAFHEEYLNRLFEGLELSTPRLLFIEQVKQFQKQDTWSRERLEEFDALFSKYLGEMPLQQLLLFFAESSYNAKTFEYLLKFEQVEECLSRQYLDLSGLSDGNFELFSRLQTIQVLKLNGIRSLNRPTAQQLLSIEREELSLNQLYTFDQWTAECFEGFHGRLNLHGLVNLDQETISKFRMGTGELILGCLNRWLPKYIEELSRGEWHLLEFQVEGELSIDHCRAISVSTAAELCLRGLRSLDMSCAEELVRFEGERLRLPDLEEVEPSVLIKLLEGTYQLSVHSTLNDFVKQLQTERERLTPRTRRPLYKSHQLPSTNIMHLGEDPKDAQQLQTLLQPYQLETSKFNRFARKGDYILIVGRTLSIADFVALKAFIRSMVGQKLWIYSQEMLGFHLETGEDPFENWTEWMNKHPVLQWLYKNWFEWPNCRVDTGLGGDSNGTIDFIDSPSPGVMGSIGYTVRQGTARSIRRRHLQAIYTRAWHSLPQVGNVSHMSGWGEKESSPRLEKMANCIVGFANLKSSPRFENARKCWGEDLAWLKRQYYDTGPYNFYWPEGSFS